MRLSLNSRLAALVGLFLALSLAYNGATPLFEAPDERDHFDYADWLANGNGLPHLVTDRAEVGEIWQPPLYYALIAAVIAPIDRSDLDTIAPLSPDWQAGLSRVAHYHTAAESFPYRHTALAVHIARGISTLLGLVTVMATFAMVRLLLPAYALVAAALVALNPQFIFMSAAVNNDNLVIALCSVALWILVRLITVADSPPHARAQAGWFVMLGLVWGLAGLAKLTGLTLGLVIGLTLLYLARRAGSWRPLLQGGLLAGGVMMLVCGWWFWRNWQLYGDPLAWSEMLAVTGGLVRPELLSWPETLRYATFLRQSFWAMFGYGVAAPDSLYRMTGAIVMLAVAGWVMRAFGARPLAGTPARFAVGILALWSLTVFVFLLRWMRQIDATNQGRLLYPAVAALSVLLALGLAAWDRRRMWLGKTAVVVLGCWAAAMPLLVIGPAYARPQPVDAKAITNPADITFGDAIRLAGYDLPATAIPGRPVVVSLYWEATRPISTSYIVALRVLDSAGRPVSGIDTLPAAGRYSTAIWEPGRPFRDTYTLPAVAGDAAPGLATLLVIVYPRGEPGAPLPVSAGGAAAGSEARVGAIKIPATAPQASEPSHPSDVMFNGSFRLLGYDAPDSAFPGGPLAIALYWEATAPDGRAYTVFVHLLNKDGELVAQSDGPPRAGTYPTSIWDAGERVVDERVLVLPPDLPAGRYRLLAGLYDPATGTRLPAFDLDGNRRPDDAVGFATVDLLGSPAGTESEK